MYKRQLFVDREESLVLVGPLGAGDVHGPGFRSGIDFDGPCLLYTSDAADERSSVDLGGRRIIKKKKVEIMTVRINI